MGVCVCVCFLSNTAGCSADGTKSLCGGAEAEEWRRKHNKSPWLQLCLMATTMADCNLYCFLISSFSLPFFIYLFILFLILCLYCWRAITCHSSNQALLHCPLEERWIFWNDAKPRLDFDQSIIRQAVWTKVQQIPSIIRAFFFFFYWLLLKSMASGPSLGD